MNHILATFILGPLLAAVLHAAEPEPLIHLTLEDVPLSAATRLLTSQSEFNVVASDQAGARRISLFLQDIDALAAIDTLCRAHNLWYEQDGSLIRIYTIEEYRRDIDSFRTEETEVFTLLYPNAMDVGYAIRDLYPARVLLSLGSEDRELRDDLERRLDRFSLLSQFSDSITTRGTVSGGQGGGGVDDDDLDRLSPRVRRLSQQSTDLSLSTDQIQRLESQAKTGEAIPEEVDRDLPRANILVTVIQRHNLVVVRTGDKQAMEEIRDLVRKLDVPTPMVLLQVQVLSVELGDGFNSVFDYQFAGGNEAGGFTTGTIQAPAPGSLNIPGTGLLNGNLTAQYVGAEFAARLQVLKDKNRATALATPVLLTANNEVSGLFIGDDRPIVTGFTEPLTIQGEGGITTIPGAPETELQEVGTTLLLTPTINADRSVTIRLMQENSSISPDPATILVPSELGEIVEQSVDVVQRRTLSGTVVAQDQQLVAIGGLIEERVELTRRGVPILGDIPLLGILFRREAQSKSRRELVLVIRPYVLNTAAEGERLSQELLERLSLHPERPEANGTESLDLYRQQEVLTPEGLPKSLLTLPPDAEPDE